MIRKWVSSLGAECIEMVTDIGRTALFGWETFRTLLQSGVSARQTVLQMYVVGVKSLSTTVVTALFVGAIMAIQVNLQLKDFGAQAFLGGLSTSVTIRNVGPILIAFILSGKVGAYTSAELGTMQVTDQINAIRCLGMDPIRYIVVPRLVAVVISSFLLLIVGLMLTIGGGVLISKWDLMINPVTYIKNIPLIVTPWSVLTGVVKSFCFGVLIAVIACYRGYHAKGGSVGVGVTVRKTAVQSLVWIIVADYALGELFAGIAAGLGQ